MNDSSQARANWSGNVVYTASELVRPRSIGAVQSAVVGARRITALGSRHSFSRIADTDGVQIALSDLPTVFDIDSARGVARVSAGLTHAQIAAALQARGLALHNLASLPHISVAGSVATGTHGSGVRQPSLAQSVLGLEVVTASGEITHIGNGHAAIDAHRVALGALGIVTAVDVAVVPTFKVATTVSLNLGWDAFEQHFATIMASAYSVSMFTRFDARGIRQVWVKRRIGDAEPGIDPVALGAVPARGPVHPCDNDPASVNEQGGVPGPWHERLPHFRAEFTPSTGAEIQAEYLLPAEFAVPASRALRQCADAFAGLLITAEIRRVAADSAWLAPSSGRDSVGFHFTFRLDQAAVDAVVVRIEEALAPFDPRPHWGKAFAARPDRLAEAYPRLREFAAYADTVDPIGRFRNPFLDRVLGGA